MCSQKEGARYVSKSIQFYKSYYRSTYKVWTQMVISVPGRIGQRSCPSEEMAHESWSMSSLLNRQSRQRYSRQRVESSVMTESWEESELKSFICPFEVSRTKGWSLPSNGHYRAKGGNSLQRPHCSVAPGVTAFSREQCNLFLSRKLRLKRVKNEVLTLSW